MIVFKEYLEVIMGTIEISEFSLIDFSRKFDSERAWQLPTIMPICGSKSFSY